MVASSFVTSNISHELEKEPTTEKADADGQQMTVLYDNRKSRPQPTTMMTSSMSKEKTVEELRKMSRASMNDNTDQACDREDSDPRF